MVRSVFVESKGNKCEACGLGNEWNGKPLTLQIHKHRSDSPQLLCPNCHTQTDDYAGNKNRQTDETKAKRSQSLKGRKRTAEHRLNLSKAAKARFLRGDWHPTTCKKLQSQIKLF